MQVWIVRSTWGVPPPHVIIGQRFRPIVSEGATLHPAGSVCNTNIGYRRGCGYSGCCCWCHQVNDVCVGDGELDDYLFKML
jgi:hypothetical protein